MAPSLTNWSLITSSSNATTPIVNSTGAKALEEGRLKTEINEVSRKPAEAFFEIVDTELIPAVRDADLETARSLLEGDLADNYGTHRESVDTIVATTVENAEATEAEVSGIIASRKGWMLAVGLVIMATIGACAIWLLSSASKDEESAHDWVAQLDGIRRTQAVVEFEPDGTILTANELFLKAMGYQLEDIVGRHHRIFMPEHLSNTPQYAEQWRTLARGEAVSGEFERRHKSGEAVWIQGAYYPILDRSGQVYKVVKFASEITDLVAVRKEANRIRSMVDQSSLSVVFATPDGRIDYANGAALECVRELEPLLGFRANDLIGKPLDSFASDPEGRRQLSIEESGLPRRFHLEVGCETLEVQLSAVTDDGEYVGAMMSWEAVTERLNSERAAKQAADREKEKSQEFIQLLNKIRLNAETLSTSAEEMTQVSGQMTVNADETFTQANVVSAAAEQVSVNVRTVATGVEEMNSAIREIARNATESARVAERAVTDAQQANSTISKLGDSSSEIGKVIKVITSIAEQTNLLALNATIEAARAGEAGKGFAVVANEVKELAKETAKATEDISGKIETIQTDTTGAVESIRLIGEVIGQIHDISNAIAGAVEEQTATASEMTRNVLGGCERHSRDRAEHHLGCKRRSAHFGRRYELPASGVRVGSDVLGTSEPGQRPRRLEQCRELRGAERG